MKDHSDPELLKAEVVKSHDCSKCSKNLRKILTFERKTFKTGILTQSD